MDHNRFAQLVAMRPTRQAVVNAAYENLVMGNKNIALCARNHKVPKTTLMSIVDHLKLLDETED